MIFCMDFRVGCCRTARAGPSAESFCSCFAFSSPGGPWLVSCLLCIIVVFQFIFCLVFTALCLINSVDSAQLCCVSQRTLPTHPLGFHSCSNSRNKVGAGPPSHQVPFPATADDGAPRPCPRLEKKPCVLPPLIVWTARSLILVSCLNLFMGGL